MQTGEQVTLLFAIFTTLFTLAVVVYYKFCKQKRAHRSRAVWINRYDATDTWSSWVLVAGTDQLLVLLDLADTAMNSAPSFQTGEIITFYMLGFTILMTVSVVVYYKYMSHSRPMDTVVGKNRKIQKMTKCDEFTDRFLRGRS